MTQKNLHIATQTDRSTQRGKTLHITAVKEYQHVKLGQMFELETGLWSQCEITLVTSSDRHHLRDGAQMSQTKRVTHSLSVCILTLSGLSQLHRVAVSMFLSVTWVGCVSVNKCLCVCVSKGPHLHIHTNILPKPQKRRLFTLINLFQNVRVLHSVKHP